METSAPSPSYSITMRLEIRNQPGMFGKIATAIGQVGGDLGAVDIVSVSRDTLVRDLTVMARDRQHEHRIAEAVKSIEGVEVRSVSDKVFLMHLGGKIRVENKVPVKTREALSMAYTPGVARVCEAIAEKTELAYNLTMKRNTVAIVTDGTAVLGLGDIGPEGAMPVMEGKAMLFREFGEINAFPICLKTKDPNEIVRVVQCLAPGFGGINLEDISAPRCFEIEDRLRESLDIPVFHDDQHGTAVVVLAALLNAVKIVDKKLEDLKVLVLGVGAAGVACTKMLMAAGVKNIVGCDRTGLVYKGRTESMNFAKEWFAEHTNPEGLRGDVTDAAKGADLFLGLSGPNTFPESALKSMAKDSIVFALANPFPEIAPEIAMRHARIVATGRSDYPNQINNVLCFPGMFRGALDVHAREINEAMKLAASRAISGCIADDELMEEHIIPSVFDKRVFRNVPAAVAKAAMETGVARRVRRMGHVARID